MDKSSRLIYRFGPFRLVPAEHQLLRETQVVPLTPKSFDLLVVLVENKGRLVTKDELLQSVWPDSFVEEANLSVKMSALRKALGETPQQIEYIETVPRRGYRFIAEVTQESEDHPAVSPLLPGEGTTPDEMPEHLTVPVTRETVSSRTGLSGSRYLILGGILALTVAISFAFITDGFKKAPFAGSEQPGIRSLAVLPFSDLSGDGSQVYFSEGMTEALITDLAKIGALRVTSRQTVAQYKATDKSLPDIGRELNVEALLTGSVLREKDRVRISVQLFNAATDTSLWTQSYERDLRDVLALQNEVVRDIVSQIKIKLSPEEQRKFSSAAQVDAQAYDHYLRGKFHLHTQTAESNEAAIAALESAIVADPTFAAAHAELAQAYVWKPFLFTPDDKKLAEKAFVAAEKALLLDPNLAVAYLARGRILWTPTNRFPHDKAIREYKRALELDPNLDEARNQLALVYCHIGAFEPALRELDLAVSINPGNSLARFRIGETLLFQGRYEEALTALRNTPKGANPALLGHQIVWALLHLERTEEAAATIAQFQKEHPEDNRGLLTSQLAVMAALAGRADEAERNIQMAIRNGKGFGHFHHTAYHIACAYSLMNKRDDAMKWLENAAEDGFPVYPMYENEKYFTNLREDPRFKALMETLRQRWGSYQNDGQ